jgi:EAL domain-containing protein (putative c-di-GMP-specific phosphodiesterase class I)
MLKRMGCDEVQGYLHSPPLAPQEVAPLLKRSFEMG